MKIKLFAIGAFLCLAVITTTCFLVMPSKMNPTDVSHGSLVVLSTSSTTTSEPNTTLTNPPLNRPTTSLNFPQNTQVAVWMWESPSHYLTTPGELDGTFARLQALGVNAVYVRIDDYIDISESAASVVRTQSLTNFDTALQVFTKKASTYGIRVHALAGSDDWETPNLSYIPLLLTQYVTNYNRRVATDEKLAGIQFDIESYSSTRFTTTENQLPILNDFITLVSTVVATVQKEQPDLTVGFAVPFWLDNTTRVLPTVPYNNKNQAAIYHIIDLLNTIKNGEILIMAYRNFAVGTNGTLELVSEEIAYANQGTTKVIVAQETLDYGEPSNATFYGQSLEKFITESHKINSGLQANKSYGGIAIHHLDSLFALQQ